jgi:hypothetical protein
VFLYFLHRFDRWERTPAALAVTAFLGGGLGATFAIAIVGAPAAASGRSCTTSWPRRSPPARSRQPSSTRSSVTARNAGLRG